MLFNSFQYWIFFLIVAVLFYSVPFRVGKVLLLCASYVFYMWWDPRFIVLILTSTVVDYFLGILLEMANARRKRLLLIVSLVVNLGFLGFFKYYNFFAGSLAALLHLPESSVILQIILPVGISFYTFASLSYTIDVYWGKMKAVRNFIDYAFFIAFFPHLIAGPIIRARQFISQIQLWRRPAAIVVQSEIVLILSGLLKKTVFADRLAVVADNYFRSEEHTSELQSHHDLVCRLLLEKTNKQKSSAANQRTESDIACATVPRSKPLRAGRDYWSKRYQLILEAWHSGRTHASRCLPPHW